MVMTGLVLQRRRALFLTVDIWLGEKVEGGGTEFLHRGRRFRVGEDYVKGEGRNQHRRIGVFCIFWDLGGAASGIWPNNAGLCAFDFPPCFLVLCFLSRGISMSAKVGAGYIYEAG